MNFINSSYFIVRLCIILAIVSLQLIYCATDNWFPKLNFRPEFGPYLGCNSSSFSRFDIPKLDSNVDIMNVSWYSVRLFKYVSLNQSYILLSGAHRRKLKNADDLYPFSGSYIVKCSFKPTNGDPYGFSPYNCEIFRKGDFKTFIGAALTSFSLGNNCEILVTCDPFWRPEEVEKTSNSLHNHAHGVKGQCQINYQVGEEMRQFQNVSDCYRPPCAQGIGLDYYVKKISSSRYEFKISTSLAMRNRIPTYKYKVSSCYLTYEENSYIMETGFSVAQNKIRPKVMYFSSYDFRNVRRTYPNRDLNTPEEALFGFFGFAMITLQSRNKQHYGLLSSAPYTTLTNLKNVGRVYLICDDTKVYDDCVTGEDTNSYFGYSLANLGDINYDRIDDFAVGAPYFEDNHAGRVYIYTTKSSCGINKEPLQIIRSVNPTKSIRFGIALHGGVDLDFNKRPDLAVASQFNNKLDVFALRHEYQAVCKFKLPVQPRPFDKDVIYPIEVMISLMKKEGSQQTIIYENDDLQNIVHQVNPDIFGIPERFQLIENSIKCEIKSNGEALRVNFNISSLSHIEKMDFSKKFAVGYRYVDNCEIINCNSMRYLIDWSTCNEMLPLVQYHCDPAPNCSADLSINVTDVSLRKNVQFGDLKSAPRKYNITLINLGPTEAKNTELLIKAFGALRVSSLALVNDTSNISITTNRASDEKMITLKITKSFYPMPNNYLFELSAYFKGLESVNSNFSNTYIEFSFKSGVEDRNESNNNYRISHLIIYKPNISITFTSQPFTNVDSREKPFDVKKGSAIQVDNLGPHLFHSYLLQNNDYTVARRVNITIRIPVMTNDGNHLVYLFDKIRAPKGGWIPVLPRITVDNKEVGSCEVPEEFVNPLKLISKETHLEHSEGNHTIPNTGVEYGDAELATINKTLIRFRRSVEIEDSIPGDSELNKHDRRSASSHEDAPKLSRTPHEVIRCGKPGVRLKKPICAEIVCMLPELSYGRPARLNVQGWLFSKTFFKEHISDVEIFTDVTSDTGIIPNTVFRTVKNIVGPLYISQNFHFPHVKPRKLSQIPIWPIILGVILGVLLLTIIIVALYKCGFFRRRIDSFKKTPQQKKKGPVIIHPGDQKPNDNAALL